MAHAADLVGVVLEDLVEDLIPFTALIQDTTSSFEQISELVRPSKRLHDLSCRAHFLLVRAQARSAFELQHRVHRAGILHAARSELSMHRFKSSWLTVVCLGFSNCGLLDTALELHARHAARDRLDDELYPPHPHDEIFCGLSSDRGMLIDSVYSLLHDEERACLRWTDEARADPKLAFLKDDL